MRYIVTLLLTVFCASLMQGSAPSDSSIDELMKAMQLESLLNQALRQMDDGMSKSMEQGLQKMIQGKTLTAAQKAALEKFRAKFDATIKEELAFGKVKDIYQKSYRETFTQEEVDAITAFYNSPAGKAITEKYPTAMQKANSLMQARIGPLTNKLQTMMDDFNRELTSAK